MNIKIIPIFEDLEKMASKKKFKDLFDIVTIGFIQSGFLNKDYLKNIINDESVVFMEKAK